MKISSNTVDIDLHVLYDRLDQREEKKIKLCKQERKFAAPEPKHKRGQSRRSKNYTVAA